MSLRPRPPRPEQDGLFESCIILQWGHFEGSDNLSHSSCRNESLCFTAQMAAGRPACVKRWSLPCSVQWMRETSNGLQLTVIFPTRTRAVLPDQYYSQLILKAGKYL